MFSGLISHYLEILETSVSHRPGERMQEEYTVPTWGPLGGGPNVSAGGPNDGSSRFGISLNSISTG